MAKLTADNLLEHLRANAVSHYDFTGVATMTAVERREVAALLRATLRMCTDLLDAMQEQEQADAAQSRH